MKAQIPEAPDDLISLIRGDDDDSTNFRIYGRLYNNFFACASLGGRITTETVRGIYVFTLHGQIYHLLPDLLPDGGHPKYLQMYFYDGEHEYQLRSGIFPELRDTVIARLMRIMESNPYAQFFRSLRDKRVDATTSIRINRDPVLDQRVYNAPTSSEVACIIMDSSLADDSGGPYIVVSGRGNTSHRLQHFWGYYDPLSYPMLFPYGDPGWRPGLPRCKRNGSQQPRYRIDPVREAITAESLLEQEEQCNVLTYSHGVVTLNER